MSRNDDEWAVFWSSLLSPLLLGEIAEGERGAFLKQLSQKELLLPNGNRKRVSYSTLQRKLKQFRERKIAGWRRKARDDRGQSRKKREKMIARAVELKREQPRRSPKMINRILNKEFGRTIPKSTMNRHLRQQGVTRLKLGVVAPKIRCRWTRHQTNALWVGDFADGPLVLQDGQALESHLSIWIDCHSRFVPDGRYYYQENLDILVDSLLRAWGGHGCSRELYVDNARIYRSKALRLACTQLNIKLLHRPPGDPPAGGIIERVIQTVQDQFEAEVRAGKVLTLTELNRYFQAWLHVDYHQTVHSATQQTPQALFTEKTAFRRHVNLSEVLEFFETRVERKVDREFSDVKVHNIYFAVDSRLRGDRVRVCYDPFSEMKEVRLLSLQGVYLGVGRRYQREKGAHPPVPPPPPQAPLDHSYLKLLEEQMRQRQQEEAQAGIDYHQAQQGWSLASFLATFAKLLGRPGGVSGLSTEEIEALANVHRRYPRVNRQLLKDAFQQAEPRTIPVIVFCLQKLLKERNA